VKTALLSNSWGSENYPRERFADTFDVLVISGEVGIRKPDPEIFHLAARRLGVAPHDCVFVDDLDRNVMVAQELGMAGVLHRRADETIPQVAELLGLDRDLMAGADA
jgi:putative hydrolase of the HAD superfamily